MRHPRIRPSIGRRAAVLAAVGSLVALSACGADSGSQAPGAPAGTLAAGATWDDTVEAAKKEGRVVLYLALANFENRVKEGFQKAYPEIELVIVRQPSGQLITKLDAERASGADGADVVINSDRAWFEEIQSNLVPATGPSVDAFADEHAYADNRYFTTVVVPFSISYNKNLVSSLGASPIEDWEDIVQPQFGNGSIGFVRPDTSPTVLQWFWFLEQELGEQYLRDVAAMQPRLFESSGTLAQAVASGELAAGLYQTPVTTGELIKAGAPVADVVARPQYTMGYWGGQVDWAKRPAAAAVLMDWLLSKEGQEAMHGWGLSASPMPEVTNDLELDEGTTIYDGILTPEQEAFQQKWNQIFLGQ